MGIYNPDYYPPGGDFATLGECEAELGRVQGIMMLSLVLNAVALIVIFMEMGGKKHAST